MHIFSIDRSFKFDYVFWVWSMICPETHVETSVRFHFLPPLSFYLFILIQLYRLFKCVFVWVCVFVSLCVYVCLRPCVIPFGNQYYEGRELTNLISFVCISTLYINGRLPMNFEKHFCFPCFFLCYNHHLCVCILPFIIYWTESNLKLPILPDTITCEQFMK